MLLETITGNLRDAYKQLQLGTMLHVDQLMNERIDNVELCNQWFYTADGEVYLLDGARKTPTLAMTREAHNPVLKNIDDAFEQLTKNGNYRPSQADVKKALAAPDTVLVALPNLRLSGEETEWRYLEISTTPAKYAKLNDEEQELAERVYGQGNDFAQNMKMLKDAKINETRIFVLNPDYVREHAQKGAVARASWLGIFVNNSLFYADGRDINDLNRVRGVRKKTDNDQFSAQKSDISSDFLRREVVTEGGAQNLGPYRPQAENVFKAHYDAILADQESAARALNDETAAGLSQLVSKYLAARGQ